MRNLLMTALLVAAFGLAGCASTPVDQESVENNELTGSSDPNNADFTKDSSTQSNQTKVITNETQSGDNETRSEARHDPGWPSLDDATIRPGGYVGDLIHEQGSRCTHNFVFASADNSSLYLGTAAHCVGKTEDPDDLVRIDVPCDERESLPIGAEVLVEGASIPGTLAYSSWGTMVDVAETDHDTCMGNDFALIEVKEDDRGKIHPAMRHFGGPVQVVNNSEAHEGDKVFIYGRSPFWISQEQIQAREAEVNGHAREGWRTTVDGYAISGDSGSPVIDEEGGAFGIVKAVGSGGVVIVSLQRALAYMREHTALQVEIAAWEVIDTSVPGGLG